MRVTSSYLTLDHEADYLVGIGGGEEPRIVLQETSKERKKRKERRLFYAYTPQEDGKFVQEWSQDLAHITTDRCLIQVTATGEIMLQEREGAPPTLLLDRNGGRVIDTWTQKGLLIGCLHPARPVYQQWRKGACELVVLDEDHRTEKTLTHAWTGGALSVCEDDKQERMAVTSWQDQTMSIFSPQGNIQTPNGICTKLLFCFIK